MKPVFCQLCKGIMFVNEGKRVVDIGLLKLDGRGTYKVKRTGRFWHHICFNRMVANNGWNNYE